MTSPATAIPPNLAAVPELARGLADRRPGARVEEVQPLHVHGQHRRGVRADRGPGIDPCHPAGHGGRDDLALGFHGHGGGIRHGAQLPAELGFLADPRRVQVEVNELLAAEYLDQLDIDG